jgi:mRNA interferase RelE/StbE
VSATFEVLYRPEVLEEDLPDIPRNLEERIFRAIETRLMTEPTRYGTRLRRSLSNLWKLRVGDYRVVYEVEGRSVRVWAIAHRKGVYAETERRQRKQKR